MDIKLQLVYKLQRFLRAFLRDSISITIGKILARLYSPIHKKNWRKMYKKIKYKEIGSPKIAVIIPCYNYGQYLLESINSVLSQKDSCDKEIIIVNDGSTDKNTLEILKLLEEEYTKYIKVIHQRNKGLSAARNIGVEATNAEYIVFLDADDCIRYDFLEKTIRLIKGIPNVDIVYSYAKLFGDIDGIWYTENLSSKKILKYNHIPSTALFRKSLWKEVGGFDEKMRSGYEDWDFWIRCAQKGFKGYAIPECLFKYRRHGMTMHNTAEEKRQDIINYIRKKNSIKKKFFNLRM